MIRIDSLRTDDFEAWLPLWHGYRGFYAAPPPLELTPLTWSRLVEDREPMHGALAWAGDTAVGLVHLVERRSSWTIGHQCYLEDLFVVEPARGQGVGRALMGYAFAWAADAGCATVHWLTHESNAAARRLYDQLGAHHGHIHYEAKLAPRPDLPQ